MDNRPATTHLRTPWDDLHVGQIVMMEGIRWRITSETTAPAPEDDPKMGVQAGDPVTTFIFTQEPDPSASPSPSRCATSLRPCAPKAKGRTA